ARPENHPPFHQAVGGHPDRLAALVWDAAAEAGRAPESPGHDRAWDARIWDARIWDASTWDPRIWDAARARPPGRARQAADARGSTRAVAARVRPDAAPVRLDRTQGRAHRRSVAPAISGDSRSETAADRAARARRQPASPVRPVGLAATNRHHHQTAGRHDALDPAGLRPAHTRATAAARL